MDQKKNTHIIAWKFTWLRDCLALFAGTVGISVSVKGYIFHKGLKGILSTHSFSEGEEKEIFE